MARRLRSAGSAVDASGPRTIDFDSDAQASYTFRTAAGTLCCKTDDLRHLCNHCTHAALQQLDRILRGGVPRAAARSENTGPYDATLRLAASVTDETMSRLRTLTADRDRFRSTFGRKVTRQTDAVFTDPPKPYDLALAKGDHR